MSRIQEALRKAEAAKASSSRVSEFLKPAESTDRGTLNEEGATCREQVVPRRDSPETFNSLRFEHLRNQCNMPGWKLDPDNVVFCARPSLAVCAEQFRTIRTRLYQIRELNPIRVLLITSSLPQEGKSFVALNLAHALVRERERRALLIDADLRIPTLHANMGAPSAPGLTEYLRGTADELSILQGDRQSDLFFIPAGSPVSEPAELLCSRRLEVLVDRLSPLFDWIIFDAPPILPVSDANLVAKHCDGVIFVVRAGSTSYELSRLGCQELRERNLLGVILNRAEAGEPYGAYSYYGGSGSARR